MGVEICFRHLHNELQFSYTSFDNFIKCLQSYCNKEQVDIINCLSWKQHKEQCQYMGPHGTFNAVCGTINDLINTLKYVYDRLPEDHGFYRDICRFLQYTIEESSYPDCEVWVNC